MNEGTFCRAHGDVTEAHRGTVEARERNGRAGVGRRIRETPREELVTVTPVKTGGWRFLGKGGSLNFISRRSISA